MVTITYLKETCSICPSQWEGMTEDHKLVYIRYRWGHLCVSVSPPHATDISEAVRGECIYEETVDSSGWDGSMSLDTLKELTRDHIKFEI